jgi:hypothetical protein
MEELSKVLSEATRSIEAGYFASICFISELHVGLTIPMYPKCSLHAVRLVTVCFRETIRNRIWSIDRIVLTSREYIIGWSRAPAKVAEVLARH